MKIFRILFFMALLGSGLMACQKDDEINTGMGGTWEGLWGFNQDAPHYYERWEFKNNGDFSAYDDDGDLYAKGSYDVNGTSFAAEYKSEASGSKYKFAGEYDAATQSITGTWGLYPSATNRGLFEMHKQ